MMEEKITLKSEVLKGNDTKIKKHETFDSILEECFGTCDDEVIVKDFSTSIGEFRESIINTHECWGFYRRRTNIIHVWIPATANFYNVIAMLAHEFGHVEPRHDDEEDQSEGYGRVTVRAVSALREVMGDTWIRNNFPS